MVQNADRLDSEIIYDRDFDYDYFGFKVSGEASNTLLQHSYLLISRDPKDKNLFCLACSKTPDCLWHCNC